MSIANMIRKVTLADAPVITSIYNRYIEETTISFEEAPLSESEMAERIREISASFPYYVYEVDGQIAGYCYAHKWKERAAYGHTLETTIYLAPRYLHHGVGTLLMKRLIDDCRKAGYRALIACITGGNEASIGLHRSLGFEQVSHFKNVGMKFGKMLDVVDLELEL